MCGIFFAKNIESKLRDQAFDLMNHRGPDFSLIKKYGDYSLGHKRLSIIDLDDRSSQPFLASDNKTTIIFNGEIYNYKELKERFNLRVKTNSDTEILVELYLKIGKRFLDELNGMFSFVIFNTENNDIFIARDRLGIKPLYYYQDNNKFIFCSEIAPILKIIGNTDYDLVGIRQYLKLRTFFRNHTLYKNIKSFPAGFYYKNGQFRQYWSIEDSNNSNWHDDDLRNLIESSIKYRQVADVETGSYLSGGIDSSIIAILARQKHSWTIGFNNFNEFEYAKLVADKYNLQHHEVLASREEFKEIATKLIKFRKEPLSVPNEVLLYQMTKEVKKLNTVVLSGEGADELFFGYDRIFTWASKHEFDLKQFDKHYSYGTHDDNEIIDYILEPYSHIKSNIDKVATFFQLDHLHGLLRRLDNSSMMCSVEARVPFVDHRLIEYMYRSPFNYRVENNCFKAPLKRIFSDILPKEVINRKKVGFPVPLEDIFSNNSSGVDGWLQFNLQTLVGENNYKDLISEFKINNVF